MQQKEKKTVISVNSHYLVFLRDVDEIDLSLEDADKEQCQLVNELKDMKKGKSSVSERKVESQKSYLRMVQRQLQMILSR